MKDLLDLLSGRKFKVLVEEHKFQNMFFIELYIKAFVYDLAEAYGIGFDNLIELKGDYMRWAVDIKKYDKVALHYMDLVKKNAAFANEVNQKLFASVDKLNRFSQKLLSNDFSQSTNLELTRFSQEQAELVRETLKWGLFAPMIEVHLPLYTDFLTELVDKRKRERNATVSVSEAVAVLSTFDGDTQAKREQLELLQLAKKVKAPKNISQFSNELMQHSSKFGWLMYNFSGPGWTEKEYRDTLSVALKENVGQKLKKLQNSAQELEKKRLDFEKVLKLSERDKKFFAIGRDFMKAKALRREALSFTAFAAEPLYQEIAKRLDLSLTQARLMTFTELETALASGTMNEAELTKRTTHFVYGVFNGGKDTELFTGEEAQRFCSIIKEDKIESDITELRGTCACIGKAAGVVRVINKPSEMKKMRKGDVLVSIATMPDIVPAMRLASAIITDSGGLTSHAAIVSRELNVPCIIGTKIATKVLHDGDKVEVDATNGVVKILTR